MKSIVKKIYPLSIFLVFFLFGCSSVNTQSTTEGELIDVYHRYLKASFEKDSDTILNQILAKNGEEPPSEDKWFNYILYQGWGSDIVKGKRVFQNIFENGTTGCVTLSGYNEKGDLLIRAYKMEKVENTWKIKGFFASAARDDYPKDHYCNPDDLGSP